MPPTSPIARLAVITAIALDHQESSARPLDAIAREKAGVLRAGGPLVLSPPGPRSRSTRSSRRLPDAALRAPCRRRGRPARSGVPWPRRARVATRHPRAAATSSKARARGPPSGVEHRRPRSSPPSELAADGFPAPRPRGDRRAASPPAAGRAASKRSPPAGTAGYGAARRRAQPGRLRAPSSRSSPSSTARSLCSSAPSPTRTCNTCCRRSRRGQAASCSPAPPRRAPPIRPR